MQVIRITTNVQVDDIDAARGFWADFMGLTHEEMNLGWVARYTSPENGEHVQLVTRDATAPEDSAMTVKVDDVDAAYKEARAAGYEIVHPLTDEPWGIRRFLVRAPGGPVVNIARHVE
ncbi:MAG: VOC family protein [Dermatophilaceae bacterium]